MCEYQVFPGDVCIKAAQVVWISMLPRWYGYRNCPGDADIQTVNIKAA